MKQTMILYHQIFENTRVKSFVPRSYWFLVLADPGNLQILFSYSTWIVSGAYKSNLPKRSTFFLFYKSNLPKGSTFFLYVSEPCLLVWREMQMQSK